MEKYNESELLAQYHCATIAEVMLKLKDERRAVRKLYGEASQEFAQMNVIIRKIKRNAKQNCLNQYGLFIGKSYQAFVEEAKRLGVSRAVPKNIAHQYIGQTIACCLNYDSEAHTAEVCGYFKVTQVNVIIDPVKLKAIEDAHKIPMKIVKVERDIERECGKYTVIELIQNVDMEMLRLIAGDADRLMIAGDFVEIPKVEVKNVYFTRGVFELGNVAGIDKTLSPQQEVQVAVCRDYIRKF